MVMALRGLLTKVDRIPERVLLWVNVGLACLVGLAHGGALAITYVKPTPEASDIRQLAAISLPIAALIVLTAAAALIRPEFRRGTLAIHGLVLAASALASLVWAASLLLRGIPEGNFAWSPGLMSAWVCYSVFVLSRYSAPSEWRNRPALIYAPPGALAVSLPIDIGVFVQLIGEMSKRFG